MLPEAGEKLAIKCPGAGNILCANTRGYPGGGQVKETYNVLKFSVHGLEPHKNNQRN